jgi:hypothetical protein
MAEYIATQNKAMAAEKHSDFTGYAKQSCACAL